MSDVVRDMRMAARRLRQAPGFASVAVLTLALGIAATSAIFSVVDAVVLRPLPYEHADRLVRVTADLQRLGVPDIGLSASELFDYRDRSDLFDDITGIWPITANLTGSSRPERVETVLAGPTYFQMLGARPQLGRLFGPQDHHTGIASPGAQLVGGDQMLDGGLQKADLGIQQIEIRIPDRVVAQGRLLSMCRTAR